MTTEELKAMAAKVAVEMKAGLTPELRALFILVRAELFQRGIFDPVLARFDTATVPQASPGEVAEELAKVAMSL
jgi:hypothetical protein